MLYESSSDAAPARIYLQPVAAPSILGLFGFAGATFMVAAHMAGWYGGRDTVLYLAPFVAMFGGLAQFLAGMWAFRARDGLATAMHGMWGSFWIAFGFLSIMFMNRPGGLPAGIFPELGFWFIVLAAITWVGAWASLSENVALFLVLFFLALGSTLEAIARLAGGGGLNMAAGYCFIISALCAFYTATALMLAECYGHSVLGVGKLRKAAQTPVVSMGCGEPGVVRGQSLNLEPQMTAR
jgi:succinate-acetate transporter protein